MVQGTEIVVGQQFGAVFGPFGERFDPLRSLSVELGPVTARNLGVRDVAHQDMTKGVLRPYADRGAALAADELLALEGVQPMLDRI